MLHLDNAVSWVASLIRSLILSVYTTIVTLNILEIYIKARQGLLKHNFICFDIVEFYPSISRQDLLNKALDFASIYDKITAEEQQKIHS